MSGQQGSYCAEFCFVAPDAGKMQGKRVRLVVEKILLIAGARASEHYVVYYVKICCKRSWENSDLTVLLTEE
jgi:hypothetical protein